MSRPLTDALKEAAHRAKGSGHNIRLTVETDGVAIWVLGDRPASRIVSWLEIEMANFPILVFNIERLLAYINEPQP